MPYFLNSVKKKTLMPIVIFDIDGVVADTGKAIIEIIQRDLGKSWVTLKDITQYEINKLSWLSEEEVKYLIIRFNQPEFYLSLSPSDGAQKAIETLKDAHWKVIFLTARPQFLYKVTHYWLKSHNFPFDDLIVCLPLEKPSYCENFSQSVLIEDRPDIIDEIARNYPHTRLFVFNQPWNQNVKAGIRIHNFNELLNIVL